jgi:hypothetical protein
VVFGDTRTQGHACGKKCYLARVCRSKNKHDKEEAPAKPNTQSMTSEEAPEQISQGEYTMFPLRKECYAPIYVTLTINNAPLTMEVDTGASLTVISEATYRATYGDQATPPRESNVKLKMYTGDEIPIKGTVEVNVPTQWSKQATPTDHHQR